MTDPMMELFACGCGHDGRLGQGRSEANHAALTRVTLPWSAAAATHRIHHVACGGYHTFVVLDAADVDPSFFLLPAADGAAAGSASAAADGPGMAAVDALPARLASAPSGSRAVVTVAFGLNEDGQLGVGDRYNKAKPTLVKALSTDASRLVVATVELNAQQGESLGPAPARATRLTRLHALTCGLYHSLAVCVEEEWSGAALAQATTAVRSCGRNTNGQLGLGDFDSRAQWVDMLLPSITDVVPAVAPASDALGLSPPIVLPLAPELQWWIETAAAGTSHSALLVRATTLAELSAFASVSAAVPLATASFVTPHAPTDVDGKVITDVRAFVREASLRYVLTCGMGDYGELGYDADLWDAQRDAEARLKRSITENARMQGMLHVAGSAVVGGAVSSGPDEAAVAEALREQAERVEAALQERPSYLGSAPASVAKAQFKFKKPTAKRRPPLSRPVMHAVRLHDRIVLTPLPSNATTHPDARAATVYLPLGVAASAFRTHLTGSAMQIVRTPAVNAEGVTTDALTARWVEHRKVLGFGCLYDRQIETQSTSVPVELCVPTPMQTRECDCPFAITSALGLKDVEFIVVSQHCTCGRARDRAARTDYLYIRGDDPFDPQFLSQPSQRTGAAASAAAYDASGVTPAVPVPASAWVPVPLPVDLVQVAITGKAEHLLIAPAGDSAGNVLALGSNYYGQLGMLSPATVDRAADLDAELEKRVAPVPVAAPFGAVRFLAAAAGSQHSMFVCATNSELK